MKNHNNQNLLATFSKFVSLNVLGMIGLSCYIIADTYFISLGLGANGLTALNLAIPVYSLISAFGLMMGIGGATRYSILRAQMLPSSHVFSHVFAWALSTGILFALCGAFFSDELSNLLGADTSTFELTNTYLKTILFFAPFFILNNVTIAFVRNDGDPKLSMAAMLLGSFSNIILDYIFIFPLDMGMFGAAFATGLAPIISLLLLSVHFIKKKNTFSLKKFHFEFRLIKEVHSLGISSFINEVSSGIVLVVFNLVILNIAGNIGVAAYGVVANFALVSIAVFTGIAQGIQPIISNNYGLGCKKNVKVTLKYALILSLAIAVITYILILFFNDNIISAFNNEGNKTLSALANIGFLIYFTGFFFCGINIAATSYFSSTEQASKAFLISLLRGCLIIVPLVVILSNSIGMIGVWLSFPIAEAVTTICTVFLLLRSNKKIKTSISVQTSH